MTRSLCLALLLTAPTSAIEPGQDGAPAPVKVNFNAVLDEVRVPPRERTLVAPVLNEVMTELESLPPGTDMQAAIDEIVAGKTATVEEKHRKSFRVHLSLSLSELVRQIGIEREKAKAAHTRKPKDEGRSDSKAPTDGLPQEQPQETAQEETPTTDSIRKGLNRYATTNFPENRQGWTNTADDAMKSKDYRTASRSYKKVIALGGGTAKVYTGYGSAEYNLGNFRGAADAAHQALELEPGYRPAEVLASLSERHVKSGSPSAKTLAGAAALMDNPAATAGMDIPGRTGSSASGGGAGSGAPSWAPGSAGIPPESVLESEKLVGQAANSLSLGDFPQAGESATRAVGTDPLNARAWTLRAVADSNLGKHKDAVYNASVALLLVPGNTTALQMRSWSFNMTGKYREAMRDADFSLAREPGNPFHHYNKAFAQAGLSDRPGATSSLKSAATLDDRFAPPYKAAVSAPQDSDLLFVFDLMGPGTGDAAQTPPARSFPSRLLYGIVAAVVLLAAASGVYVLRRKG